MKKVFVMLSLMALSTVFAVSCSSTTEKEDTPERREPPHERHDDRR